MHKMQYIENDAQKMLVAKNRLLIKKVNNFYFNQAYIKAILSIHELVMFTKLHDTLVKM